MFLLFYLLGFMIGVLCVITDCQTQKEKLLKEKNELYTRILHLEELNFELAHKIKEG